MFRLPGSEQQPRQKRSGRQKSARRTKRQAQVLYGRSSRLYPQGHGYQRDGAGQQKRNHLSQGK